jgi:hypothetical protein
MLAADAIGSNVSAPSPSYETTPERKRRPGRPKGSKNKPKVLQSYEQQPQPVIKRKPGRPKGSKNKPKQLAT